jgi:hypothetical protein
MVCKAFFFFEFSAYYTTLKTEELYSSEMSANLHQITCLISQERVPLNSIKAKTHSVA